MSNNSLCGGGSDRGRSKRRPTQSEIDQRARQQAARSMTRRGANRRSRTSDSFSESNSSSISPPTSPESRSVGRCETAFRNALVKRCHLRTSKFNCDQEEKNNIQDTFEACVENALHNLSCFDIQPGVSGLLTLPGGGKRKRNEISKRKASSSEGEDDDPAVAAYERSRQHDASSKSLRRRERRET